MSRWLDGELRGLIAALPKFPPGQAMYLFYRRGSLAMSSKPFADTGDELAGYQQVTTLRIPRQKSKEDLLEWLQHELKGIACFP